MTESYTAAYFFILYIISQSCWINVHNYYFDIILHRCFLYIWIRLTLCSNYVFLLIYQLIIVIKLSNSFESINIACVCHTQNVWILLTLYLKCVQINVSVLTHYALVYFVVENYIVSNTINFYWCNTSITQHVTVFTFLKSRLIDFSVNCLKVCFIL